MVDAGEVPAFGDGGHGDGALHATPGLEGLDHRGQAPGFPLLVERLVEPLEPLRRLGDRPDLGLTDHWRRGGGTAHLREPPEVGRAPAGPAWIAEIVSEQQGCEAERGGFEVSQRIFAGAAEIAHGVIFDRGPIDGGEITRAHPARPLDRITTVGVHAVAGLFGKQCRRDDPAELACLCQLAREPIPTRSRFIDEDQGWGFGWQRAHEWINVAWPRPKGAKVDDLSVVLVGARGHRDGVLGDIQTAIERARLVHG
jgi:hypothetical protein